MLDFKTSSYILLPHLRSWLVALLIHRTMFGQSRIAWLAQLGEHQSAEWEVVGSNLGQTNTQGL